MPVQYPIRAVAKLTGVAVDTLRAWERRYGAVRPERDGSLRLYGEAEVRRLRLLRAAIDQGHSIGQIARLSDAELEQLARSSLLARRPAEGDIPAPGLERVLDALDRYDVAGINQELGRLALLLRPRDLVYRAMLPLMREAGARWERGEFGVAQEHMLSASVRHLLGGLLRIEGTGDADRVIVLTTPPGELHEFGVLAAAMLAAARQWRVVYLGPNLPAEEITRAAGKTRARVVALGVVEVNATPATRAEIERVAAELPEGAGLWIGGTGRSVAAGAGGSIEVEDMEEFERRLGCL